MSEYDTSGAMRLWPEVAVATALVLGLPVALVWWLRAGGVVASAWLCVILALALSMVVSGVASAIWKRGQGAERAVFSELLLWGWLRRLRAERQLADLLGRLGDLPSERERNGDVSMLDEPTAEFLTELALALDAQDPYTGGHSRRVARHAAMVARELKLSDDEVRRIRTAAILHDIGKLLVPAAVLNKRDVLTPEEFEAMKRHATEGAAMVEGLGDDDLTAIVRHHHERFDGKGYPAGLSGDEFPLGARIVAVADTFDAITSLRPYRSAASHKQALDLLVETAGTQLDPAAVRSFLRYYAGRKGSTLLALVAVAPQRLFAWMHGNASAAGNVAFGDLAATVASVATVGLAALGTAAAVALNHAARHREAENQRLTATAVSGSPRASVVPGPRSGTDAPAPPAVLSGSSSIPRSLVSIAAARSVAASPRRHVPAASPRPRGLGQAPAPVGGGHRSNGGAGTVSHSVPPARSGGHHRGSGGGSGAQSTPGSGHGGPGTSSPQTVASPEPNVAAPVAPSAPPSAPTTTTAPPSATASPTAGSPTSTPSVPPSGPITKDQCKNGGYAQYGFKNQGQCIAGMQSPGH